MINDKTVIFFFKNQKAVRKSGRRGEGIHIISHKYHPLEILAMIERYFV